MGGLVARLALQGRWEAFKTIPGSRLLQLGTPNAGSHSIAAVLMARDDFIQTIERWFDWKHDMREFLEIVREFPGVLELLPWPGDNGLAGDGVDYFDSALWQSWYEQDQDEKKSKSWLPPAKGRARTMRAQAIASLRAGEHRPGNALSTSPAARRHRAPCASSMGQVEIGSIRRGRRSRDLEIGHPARRASLVHRRRARRSGQPRAGLRGLSRTDRER
jgi:hypothetical protein